MFDAICLAFPDVDPKRTVMIGDQYDLNYRHKHFVYHSFLELKLILLLVIDKVQQHYLYLVEQQAKNIWILLNNKLKNIQLNEIFCLIFVSKMSDNFYNFLNQMKKTNYNKIYSI